MLYTRDTYRVLNKLIISCNFPETTANFEKKLLQK